MVATSADGRLIATASSRATGSVRVTNANGRLLANLWDHPAGATQVAFSPSGKYLAAGTADGQIGVWSTADFQPLRKLAGHEKPIEALAFSWDDRRLASSCKKRMARLWDLESGEEVLRVGDYMGEIKAMAFAPDGQRLVTTNQDGPTVESGNDCRNQGLPARQVALGQHVGRAEARDRMGLEHRRIPDCRRRVALVPLRIRSTLRSGSTARDVHHHADLD
jgi:WD40 repeat protein